MRIGSLSRSFVGLTAISAAAAVLSTGAQCALAQPPGAYGPGVQPQPVRQALFTSPFSGVFAKQKSPYVDAHGNPVVVPAQYGQPCDCAEGYASDPYVGCGDACGCDACGGSGCDACGGGFGGGHGGFHGPFPMGAGGTDPSVGYDLMNDVGVGGHLVDQRGPHYFDLRAEAVYLQRNETFAQDIDFTIFNLGGPIVLSSSQLEYDEQAGFRVLGRFDLGPLSVLEFGYMGVYNFESTASFTDPNPVDPVAGTGNLFSLFSDFGTNPATVAVAGGPMPETERSITHSITIDSDLQSAEMSYRRYWVGFLPRISGTMLAGFRYTRLKEDFLFSTIGEASQNYNLRADNDLAGFQTGADMWICLFQGFRIGAEGKVGIYNNHYTLRNFIETEPLGTTPPTLDERFEDDEVAFISEASVDLVADILPSWSIRAGYEILFLNSVVLAGENFNTASPYGLPAQATRVPFVNEQGSDYYHGGHVGVEFIW